jgi:hypothetical protein
MHFTVWLMEVEVGWEHKVKTSEGRTWEQMAALPQFCSAASKQAPAGVPILMEEGWTRSEKQSTGWLYLVVLPGLLIPIWVAGGAFLGGA